MFVVFTVVWLAVLGLGLPMLANRQVRLEVYDIIEFHWSRWRARRQFPGATLVVKELHAPDEPRTSAADQVSSTSKSPVSTA